MTTATQALSVVNADVSNEIAQANAAVVRAGQNGDLGQQEQAVQWLFAATKTEQDLALLSAAINPPPPTPTAKPDFGVFHGNDQAAAVTPARILDYCDNNATTYNFTPARTAYMNGKKPMVKCGDLAPGQPTALAKVLIAAGFPHADIPIMWEGNQDVWETWNENKYTAAQFIARFLAIVAEMDAVPGAKFSYWWCPNLGQTGNQKTGRNQLDTWPGVGPNKNIGVAPDGYFQSKDGSDIIGQLAPFEALAKSASARFGGLCETGPDNGATDTSDLDAPAAWTALLNHAETYTSPIQTGWDFIMHFGLLKKNGGSFNSDNSAGDVAAIQAFYAA